MAKPRVHPVNPALCAHAVPLLGCERMPILCVAGVALVPIAATGVVHWQPDLFAPVVFFPLWAIMRLIFLWDPRSMGKLLEHLSWETARYSPRVAVGSKTALRGKGRGMFRLVGQLMKGAVRS